MQEKIYESESYAIRGALFEVHKNLGAGFTEDVYQLALEMEFAERKIPFEAQKDFQVFYKGTPLPKLFKVDFVCYGKIILELKAVKTLLPEHVAQLINYLRIANYKLGYLINFNSAEKLNPKPYFNNYYMPTTQEP